jgi:cytoskeleton protein RodZ
METVGEFFKQVRETKGLTIDEVASKTRIHPDFLRALEEGNYSKLPDQVFAKGFVRSYARSLGLDEDDAMRRFVESAGMFYDKQVQLERLRLQQVEDDRRKKANRKIVIAAVGVALLALVLLLTREQSSLVGDHLLTEPSPAKPVEPASAPKVPAVPAPPGKIEMPKGDSPPGQTDSLPALPGTRGGEDPATRQQTPAQPAPSSEARRSEVTSPLLAAPDPLSSLSRQAGLTDKEPLVLGLEALELSWVVVQVDDSSPHEALLRPGERATWTASDRFILTLGNAGGVRVELNGVPQGPFGASGQVAREILLKR